MFGYNTRCQKFLWFFFVRSFVAHSRRSTRPISWQERGTKKKTDLGRLVGKVQLRFWHRSMSFFWTVLQRTSDGNGLHPKQECDSARTNPNLLHRLDIVCFQPRTTPIVKTLAQVQHLNWFPRKSKSSILYPEPRSIESVRFNFYCSQPLSEQQNGIKVNIKQDARHCINRHRVVINSWECVCCTFLYRSAPRGHTHSFLHWVVVSELLS